MEVEITLEQDIRKGQHKDQKIQAIKQKIKENNTPCFRENEQGTSWYDRRIWVPDTKHLVELLLHKLLVQPIRLTKIYKDVP